MLEKFGLNISGRGWTREKIKDMIREQDLQGPIFDELLDIYREYDMVNGTSLTSGFWGNIMYNLYESLWGI